MPDSLFSLISRIMGRCGTLRCFYSMFKSFLSCMLTMESRLRSSNMNELERAQGTAQLRADRLSERFKSKFFELLRVRGAPRSAFGFAELINFLTFGRNLNLSSSTSNYLSHDGGVSARSDGIYISTANMT